MEVLTESPQGTKLRIDADRQWEGQQGDSVLRVQGQSADGGAIFDAAYVEIAEQEAQAVSQVLSVLDSPPAELVDHIAQEVQATFRSRLSGRDAAQIAQIATLATQQWVMQSLGASSEQWKQQSGASPIKRLAERFQRAASKRRGPYAGSKTNGQTD
jgi:hypothetical protein